MRRWFPADEVTVPEAKFLDVILYSREQLVKEYEAMPGKGDPASLPAAPWGIISIKAQDENYETPMQVTPTSTTQVLFVETSCGTTSKLQRRRLCMSRCGSLMQCWNLPKMDNPALCDDEHINRMPGHYSCMHCMFKYGGLHLTGKHGTRD